MKALTVEIFFPVPQTWSLCRVCEPVLTEGKMAEPLRTNAAEALPEEWQRDLDQLHELVGQLSQLWGDQILIRIQDPLAFPGTLKAFLYRIREYPTFVIGRREKITGFQMQRLQEAIAAGLANRSQGQETT